MSHVEAVLRRLGAVQLDFVNVVAPAHRLVLFSRLGPYDTRHLDEAFRRGGFTEQWAHEASIVPMSAWPLLAHRREAHRVRPWGFEKELERHPDYTEGVLSAVRARGPLSAEELSAPEGRARRLPGAWFRSFPRAVLEAHFGRGLLAVTGRRPSFARVYDLAERVVPPELRDKSLSRGDQLKGLLRIAARAHGIATAADLVDYFRLPPREAKGIVEELVEAGELERVSVEGWREVAYLHPEARNGSRARAAALLSPFDPLVWTRNRAERLFDFEYRIEIYVPEGKRRWGYYVLPFLLGERIVARVDLKADREGRRLLVKAAYLEPHARAGPTAEALARELAEVVRWLGLETVSVERRGGLSRALAAAVKGGRASRKPGGGASRGSRRRGRSESARRPSPA